MKLISLRSTVFTLILRFLTVAINLSTNQKDHRIVTFFSCLLPCTITVLLYVWKSMMFKRKLESGKQTQRTQYCTYASKDSRLRDFSLIKKVTSGGRGKSRHLKPWHDVQFQSHVARISFLKRPCSFHFTNVVSHLY